MLGNRGAGEQGTAKPPHEGAQRSLGHAAVPEPRRRGGVSRAEPAPFIQEVKATSGSMKTNREPGGKEGGRAGGQRRGSARGAAAAEREGPGGRRAVPAGDVHAPRSPSSTRRPPAGPLRVAGSGRRAAGPRLRSSAAGAGPGGCAAPGSEAWKGFCTSGPTISQVRGGRRGAAGHLVFGQLVPSRGHSVPLPISPPLRSLPLVGPIPDRFDREFESAHHPENGTRTFGNLRGSLCLGNSEQSPLTLSVSLQSLFLHPLWTAFC